MKQVSPIPGNEQERIDALKSYEILDTAPEERYDNLTQLAAEVCDVPICLISLLDEDRQWFKSKFGLNANQTPRNISLCQYTIMAEGTMEIQNALEDDRFKNNVLITQDPNFRFYAGHPLINENGLAIGTLCVIDTKPKKLAQNQLNALKTLAKEVMLAISSRKEKKEIVKANKIINKLQRESAIELDAINDAVVRIELSPYGKILNINSNFTKVFGYDSELIGSNHKALLFEEDKINKEYHDFWENLRLNIPQSAEFKRKSKTGKVLWIKGSYMPVLSDEGVVSKVIKIAYDTTQTKKALKEVVDLKSAIDQSAIVAVTDVKGRITYVNDRFCDISKYSRKELIGQDHRIVNSGHHSKEFMSNLWKTIAGGEVWHGEIKNKAKDDNFYWVDTTIVPILNYKGKPYQYIVIRSDITEHHRFSLEIQKKNEELDQFSYIVSHDLKAPLRAISTLSTFLEEDLDGKLDEDTLTNFNMLKSRVGRMDGLINGILEYSKIGRIEASVDEFLANEAIDEVLAGLSLNSNFEIKVDNNLPTIEYNRIQFQQILQNLIGNGLKYHDKEKGTVEVIYNDLEDYHEFTVKDDGPGIETQYHDRVFTVFQTLQSRDDIESTGVGLSIVKKIIEANNGTIRIDSDLGKGCSFIFTIPKQF